MKHESGSEEPAPSASRQQKMYFFGPNLHGCEKDLKFTSPGLLNSVGRKNGSWKYILTLSKWEKVFMEQKLPPNTKFHTTAAKLTAGQCALIAATLPNPIRFNSAHPSAYILRRQSQILRLMKLVPKFPPVKKAEKK